MEMDRVTAICALRAMIPQLVERGFCSKEHQDYFKSAIHKAINELQRPDDSIIAPDLDNGLAEIHFLPVCTKCRNVINHKIDYKDDDAFSFNGPFTGYHPKRCTITPNRCPTCGAFLTSIIIPTKLPFNEKGLDSDEK